LGSDHINEKPSKNFHHAIRLAKSVCLPLNRMVTVNFSHTSVPPEQTDRSFRTIRAAFGKWARRPKQSNVMEAVPPTYIWVIENPGSNGHLHVHWAVHVPAARYKDFTKRLEKWVRDVAQDSYSNKVVHIRPVKNELGLERYLLKGLHKPLAKKYGIRYRPQGFVTGKRIGHSKNLGPVERAKMCALGVHPKSKPWVENKYGNPLKASA
jgi:hypothetical protein